MAKFTLQSYSFRGMFQTNTLLENLNKIYLQKLRGFSNLNMDVSVLRLDVFHPIVSGNKWFKLKYYLQEALDQNKEIVASYGGAYSNHLVALAYAAKELGLKSKGFIRGEGTNSFTLAEAVTYGMELIFLSRENYKLQKRLDTFPSSESIYWIPEGGYGKLGAIGAGEILSVVDTSPFTHIACAVGTGTMIAGLITAAKSTQKIIGISVLKNNVALINDIRNLLPNSKANEDIHLISNYHFGGYAKKTTELITSIIDFWKTEKIPTDFVYTGKLIYACNQLIKQGYFPQESKLLIIHSGGLQGNRTIEPGVLPF